MTYENIEIEVAENIATIRINREAKLNALTINTLLEIKQAVDWGNTQTHIYGFILTGTGTKAFAAGADISEFAAFNVEEGTKMSASGHAVMFTIENSPKPVIAAVNGFALGGGCELAMACHLRIASPNAKFGQPEVNLGVPPGYGGTQRLVQLIGKGRALELLLSAKTINAETAEKYGLINAIVEQEVLLSTSKEWLLNITQKSPMALANVINCVNDCVNETKNGFDTEINLFGKAFGTTDFAKGTAAFLAKEKADFRN